MSKKYDWKKSEFSCSLSVFYKKYFKISNFFFKFHPILFKKLSSGTSICRANFETETKIKTFFWKKKMKKKVFFQFFLIKNFWFFEKKRSRVWIKIIIILIPNTYFLRFLKSALLIVWSLFPAHSFRNFDDNTCTKNEPAIFVLYGENGPRSLS